MKPDEIAAKWHEIASQGTIKGPDTFFRFIAEWIAFNAIYASRLGHVRKERKQVMGLASLSGASRRHQELLNSDNDYQRAVADIKSSGVYDDRDGTHHEIRDEKNLEELLNCVYQIRCNLFHGGKQPDAARDATLVNAGYQVISKLISPFILEVTASGAG